MKLVYALTSEQSRLLADAIRQGKLAQFGVIDIRPFPRDDHDYDAYLHELEMQLAEESGDTTSVPEPPKQQDPKPDTPPSPPKRWPWWWKLIAILFVVATALFISADPRWYNWSDRRPEIKKDEDGKGAPDGAKPGGAGGVKGQDVPRKANAIAD